MTIVVQDAALVALIVVIIVLLSVRTIPPHYIVALSPSFARQDILNNHNQWSIEQVHQNYTRIYIPPGFMKLAKNSTECKMEQRYPRPPGISAVTYVSDGKTLNATLWLSHALIQPPSNASAWLRPPFREIPWFDIGYYTSIHVHSVYDTGGTDYRIGVGWNVQNETWTTTVVEFSPVGDEKVLNQYKYSIPLGKNYIDLSFNLESVNYPSLYDILFYAADDYVKDGLLCRMTDLASRVYVPPPEFSITAMPSTVTLRPGDETNVELKVKSNTSIRSQVSLFLNTSKDIQTSIIPNETFLSPNGIVTPILNIKALEGARPHPYTLPIVADFSIPTEAKSITTTEAGTLTIQTARGSNTAFTDQVSNLTATVLPPFTPDQRLKNFYNDWLSTISGIWTFLAGVAAVTLPLIIRAYKSRNKSKPLK
jgi:hypothetical protein